MTLQTRRILYIFFVTVFFLAAPPLILYTAGYRYDFAFYRVVETGSLVVKSNPPGAHVRLDGELRKEPTPTIINTILPGKIKLLVEKEGYLPWEKEIEVKPRVTSFEESITLFAKSEPQALTERPVAEYWWNAQEDKLAYSTPEGTLRLLNTLNGRDTLIANLPAGSAPRLAWSPHEDAFLFSRIDARKREEFIIVSVLSPERIIPLADVTSSRLTGVQWDMRTKSSLYGLNAKRELVRVHYLLKTERTVAEGPLLSYRAEEDRILLVSEARGGSPLLSWISPADQSTVHLVSGVPFSERHELVRTSSQYIVLANPSARELVIVDPTVRDANSDAEPVVIPEVREFAIAGDGSVVVYSDGFSLYARSLTTPLSVLPAAHEKGTLITRYSKPVASLSVNQNGSHVFYVVDGELRVNEVASSSDPRSTTLLSGLRSIRSLGFASRRNALLFIGADRVLQSLALSREDSRPFLFGD